MKLESRQLIELIGLLAVIASLVFVGMQLFLDRKVAIGDQYFNRAESQRSELRTLMESDVYFEVYEAGWNRGFRPGWWNQEVAAEVLPLIDSGKMSVKEIGLSELRSRSNILGLDNLYFQYRQGLLNPDDWMKFREIMKNTIANNVIDRSIYSAETRPIQEVVENILLELANQ